MNSIKLFERSICAKFVSEPSAKRVLGKFIDVKKFEFNRRDLRCVKLQQKVFSSNFVKLFEAIFKTSKLSKLSNDLSSIVFRLLP